MAVLFLAGGLASIGNPFGTGVTMPVLANTMVWAGVPAAAYLLAGIGFGRLLSPLYRGAGDALSMQIALGTGVMLTLSHLLGVLGLFGGAAGRVVAILVVLIGIGLLVHQVIVAGRRGELPRLDLRTWVYAAAGAPALALLLVAASNPPGWLWASEGRGYDALSYHLQLPQEWVELGRLAPLEHNVYSFLPSYMEAAFYHMGVVVGGREGLLAGEGHGLLMAQWMHAGVAVLCAIMVARLVIALAARPALRGFTRSDGGEATETSERHPDRHSAIAAMLTGAMVLSTPWVLVTGSLAYNDLGVVALLAAALVAAVDGRLSPARRGLVVGLLIGIACGVKPTALLFAGIPAGLVLLAFANRREWGVLVLAGSIAGLAMLAPWLVRNIVYAGNPVFPFATSVFGLGHWSEEQASRYVAAHAFDGTLLERGALLFRIDEADPAGARHRGILHPQWGPFLVIILGAVVAALISVRTRALAAILFLMLLLQVLAWLAATHLQSRFLLPLIVPGAALFGLALADWMGRARLVSTGGLAIVLVMAVTSVLLFAREPQIPGAGPNQALVAGPGARTGELFRDEFARLMPREQREFLGEVGPEVYINLALPPEALVLLVGDATPLYYTRDVLYATTWDRTPLGQAMIDHPDHPRAWAASLAAGGVTHLLVNYAELDRLERSGFLDPLLTIERIERFTDAHGRPVRIWPETGVVLYELAEVGAAAAGEGHGERCSAEDVT